MRYSYEIKPRPAELGGGWRLCLLEDGEEVGGGVFPVKPADPHQGMVWWNAMSQDERSYWLEIAGSAQSSDAYDAFLLADAQSLDEVVLKRGEQCIIP